MGPRTDHHPFAAADTPSFLDLLDRVTADEQLDPRRKADLRSAIKSLGQWLGSDLTAMPAHPRYLRERLAGFHPAAAGVSRKRLQNVRSAIAFALDRYGFGVAAAIIWRPCRRQRRRPTTVYPTSFSGAACRVCCTSSARRVSRPSR
jgi:hypothetical protein